MKKKEQISRRGLRSLLSTLCILCFLCCPLFVFGEETEPSEEDEYYQEQMEASGADELPDSLPDETNELLEGLGIGSLNADEFLNLSPDKLLNQALNIMGEQSRDPLRCVVSIIGIMLLCAFLQGMKVSFGEQDLTRIFGIVCVLMCIALMVSPILSCIHDASETIHGSFVFMTAFIPVLGSVMTVSGQTVTATSYSFLMLGASETISALCSNFILHIILALSITSSAAPKLNTSGLTAFLHKTVKWILGFSMSIFVSIMSLQTIVGSASDTVAVKAAKFVVGSAIPVVGGALSEAITSVQSYLGLLKTTVGAFGIIAGAGIFLPIIIRIILWQIGIQLCSAVGELLGLSEISGLLKSVGSVMGLLLAVLLCTALMIIISTGIMLTIGGIK